MSIVLLLPWNALVTAESQRETVYRRQGEAESVLLLAGLKVKLGSGQGMKLVISAEVCVR